MPSGVYKRNPFTKKHKENIKLGHIGKASGMLGRIHSKKTKEKMSKVHKSIGTQPPHPKGRKCHFWKGGVTNLNRMIRSRFIYRQWVSDIFTRDSFTCQDCFKIGGILHAHHIIKLSTLIKMNKIKNIEEAEKCNEIYNLNNGMTLCLDCHKKRHKHNF